MNALHTTDHATGLLVAYTPTASGRGLWINDGRKYRRLPKLRFGLTLLGKAKAEIDACAR